MDIGSALHLLGLSLEVFLVDLLLSGDNAVVIALACRHLGADQRVQVLTAGTGIAVVLRVVLALLASVLLRLPLVKLVGGIALVVIALRLMLDDGAGADGAGGQSDRAAADSAAVLRTIVVADVVMSIDNVMAVAAIAHGRVGVIALGVVFSVPLLAFGSWLVASLVADYPLILPVGGALLGWIAGGIAVSDPLYAGWIEQQSPMLGVVVPLLAAVYVLVQARIVRERRTAAAALRPQPLPRHQEMTALATSPAAAVSVAGFVAAAKPDPTALTRAAAAAAQPVAGSQTKAASERPPSPGEVRDLPLRAPHWMLVGGVVAAIGTLGGLLFMARMPPPAPMRQYACANSSILVSYNTGGSRIRMTSGNATQEGVVRPGNQIEWGPAQPPGASLGIIAPDSIRYADARTLGLGDPRGPNLDCTIR